MSIIFILRVLWFCLLSSMTSGQAVISVARGTTFIVQKPGQFTIFVSKTGRAQQTVTVVVEIVNGTVAGHSDFIGTSQSIAFPAGVEDLMTSTTFTVADDGQPEPDITYAIQMKVTSGDAVISQSSIATVAVVANNDPFGVFGLLMPILPVVVQEKANNGSILSLVIERKRGNYDTVSVTYEVLGNQSTAVPGLDVIPASDVVKFGPGESNRTINLLIVSDQIPENDETFIVRLVSIAGGYSVDPSNNRPTINKSCSELSFTILQNNAPIRFSQAEYRAYIDSFYSTVFLTVYRGIDIDGKSLIGPINQPALVSYYLLSGTAVFSVDFLGANGSIGFSPGITSSNIAIQVLPSTTKKSDSRFSVILHDPTGDVVLVQPTVATIIINSNDDYRGVLSWKLPNGNQSLYPLITVDVDEDTALNLTVVRSGGTYGIVSVQWLLTRNDSSSVMDGFSLELNPRFGLIVINDGISEKGVSLTVVDSNKPTPALMYRLDLLPDTVTGGARIGAVPSTYIIVKDSHAAYGIVEFANSSAQKIIMEENVRKLRLLLHRDGGTIGDLVVSYDAVYSWNGTMVRDVFKSSVPGSVDILAGQNMSSFDIIIKETVFLRRGASFLLNLTGVHLAMKPVVGPYKSPLLGSGRSMAVVVTSVAANGEVGFLDTTTRTLSGPLASNGSLVKLPVVRDGINGNVTIFWNISGTDGSSGQLTDSEIVPLSGSISMLSGESAADVVILVLPKNKTELEKAFLVTLLATEPQNMQTLKPGSLQVKVIIPEMGNPAGVFHFGSEMNRFYVIQEEKDVLQVTVVRSGSSIVNASVLYLLEPNGDSKFYGGSNVLYFQPTETTKRVAIIARDDGVPQLDVMYTLHLRSYGQRQVVIGEPNTINVTVSAANQPYGLFSFPVLNYTVTTVKRKGQYVYNASMAVTRLKGSFSLATVDWSLIDTTGLIYLNPIVGTLTFQVGQSEGRIDIRVVADDIPRLNVSCRVILSNPTGNAVLGPYPNAVLVIVSYDYAIYFTESRIQMLVKTSRTVNITRDGPVNESLTLRCQTVNGTAYAWQDFIPVDLQLTFGKGERSKELNISILESGIPMPDQSFRVIIYDLSAPFVVTFNLTVIITAHSVSNGEFRFGPPFSKTGNEGVAANFAIIRDKGTYNGAVVWFEIRTMNGSVVPDGVQFKQGTGSILFGNLQALGEISIFPLDDGIPEFDQQFQIFLYNVSGGPSSDPGRLATKDLVVNFTLAQSNHPYGFYHFQVGSGQVYIAEDYLPGQENTTVASLVVERTSGAKNFIRVLWEAYSYQIAGAHTLPTAWDILLLGSVPSSLRQVPSKRRPGTGTVVLEFNGCSSCYVTALEPRRSDATLLQNEFTLTAWVQSTSETMSGCVVALTSPDGSMVYYALVLASLNNGTIAMKFQYQNDSQTMLSLTFGLDISVADGLWHFLLVEVYSGMVEVFFDGINRGQRVLISALQSRTTVATLSVGATKSGQNLYSGLMQDVRIYDGKLDSLQIQELYKMPSVKDISLISGYLIFQAQDNRQIISFSSLDNNIEEPNKVFSIRLVCSKKLADIPSMDDTSIVTVLKSDNANGLFGFVGTYVPSPIDMLDGSIACLVERRKGASDSVTLSWMAVRNDSNMTSLPTNEFINVTGVVLFQPGQRFTNITLSLYDDGLPKLTEYLILTAVSVLPGDGLVGSTPTSGASTDPDTSSLKLIIQPRNYPYGLLQFSSDTLPPKPNDPRIPPAIVKVQRSVSENIGVVYLLVVRAQGILGFVSAEWKTVDGTARSSGKAALDYITSAGLLTLNPGQRYFYINVTILPPPSPVGQRQFDVVLLNPKGGAGLGMGSAMTVSIEASRLASGVFQFADSSMGVTVEEISGAVAVFNVVRLSGGVDSAVVSWQFLLGGNYSDLNNTDGTIYFASGQMSASLNVVMVNDGIPSLDHLYTIQLINTTKGYLGETSKLFANLTVLANNNPYGVFIISSATCYLEVQSVAANVSIVVERKKNSGLFGSVIVNYSTLSPTETYPYIPANVLRADYADYDYSTGSVVFPSNSTTAAFNISSKADNRPELDQSIFARLTAVSLVRGEQSRPVLNSPRLGDVLETYAQIVIKEHNNPNGVLQFPNSSIRITEDHSGPAVYVLRTGGSFGMVSVRFETISGTAVVGKDFSISSDKVTLGDGETRAPVPVAIINNQVPQLEHFFTIQLLNETTGGARLGLVTRTVVTIEDYDYPHGLFAFEGSLAVVNEPRGGEQSPYVLTIQRTHGTFGVVEVSWMASIAGETIVKGISPTSGKVFFTSSEAQEQVTVNILPVDPSQVMKDITLTISDATNGGSVDASKNRFIIRVIPLASPYGSVLFNQSSYNVVEPIQPSVQYLPLSRINGTYGTLRVFYSSEGADILREATADGSSVFDYYRSPLPLNINAVGTVWNVMTETDPLLACATYCLLSRSCQSFVFVQQRSDCIWFPSLNSPSLENRTGYALYAKNPDKADSLYNRLATPRLDFLAEDSANVTFASGSATCNVPVYILPDNTPELTEKFVARLLKVELVDGDIGNPNFFPKLGALVSADVYIGANQDPNGVFSIYSADPMAVSGGQMILVEQKPSYSVQLVVERKGGSIGQVSVDWFIDSLYTTAIKGQEYFADGATLIFQPGDTLRVITVGIGQTNIPTDDKAVVVTLGRTQGGATIGNRSNVSIIIVAHDFVAGLLSFNQTSYFVNEGDLVMVAVERTQPAHGRVTLIWQITTESSPPADQRFLSTSGMISFNQGELEKIFVVNVALRNLPAVNDEYHIILTNVTTTGVRPSGAAAVSPSGGVAAVTISGGHDPHGVFQFSSSSLNVKTPAANTTIKLTVIRKQGTMGSVQMFYLVGLGSLDPLDGQTILAKPNVSFIPVAQASQTFRNGDNETQVSVSLLDDGYPRPNQVFLVNLTQVQLLQPASSAFVPRIAFEGAVAQVTILAGDGVQGEVLFLPQYATMTVESVASNITLQVHRDKGTFGQVSVFCFAQTPKNGANQGEDFNFSPREIYFGPGEKDQPMTVEIVPTNAPKPDRQFQIVLASPKNGLKLGSPSQAVITILANDLAGGVVNFDSPDNVTIKMPASASTAAASKVVLRVVRGPGIYGIVNVPFKVSGVNTQQSMSHLSPSSGVVTFNDRQSFTILEIAPVMGSVIDQDELYAVTLLQPDGGAVLGKINQKLVILQNKGTPSGIVQIYVANTKNTTARAHAVDQAVYLDVVRTDGATGRIAVDVTTQSLTAFGRSGSDLYLSVLDQMLGISVQRWFSLSAHSDIFVVQLNNKLVGSMSSQVGSNGALRSETSRNITALYRWQGMLVYVQSIETDGAQSLTAFNTDDGSSYMFVANGGSEAHSETKSRLYQLQKDGSLLVVQDINTMGAADVLVIVNQGKRLLIVANYQSDRGSTNVLSATYLWDETLLRFSDSPFQYLSTKGARVLEKMVIGNTTYVMIGNYFDSDLQSFELSSILYRVGDSCHLILHQKITTRRIIDMVSFNTDGSTYLVIAHSANGSSQLQQVVVVSQWNELIEQFLSIQELNIRQVQRLQLIRLEANGPEHLVVASLMASEVYRWDTGKFTKVWQGGSFLDLHPFPVNQSSGRLVVVTDIPSNTSQPITVWQMSMIGNSDFVPRTVTMVFEDGQTLLHTSAAILDDVTHNENEVFYAQLVNPQFEAQIGKDWQVEITILSNLNPYGVIEFAQDSLNQNVDEALNRDTSLSLRVLRQQGTSGQVVVSWRAAAVSQSTLFITQTEGQVVFGDGVASAFINITIHVDGPLSSDQTNILRLVDVLQSTGSDRGLGAVIGANAIATLLVYASDPTYGSVSWESSVYFISAPNKTAFVLTTYILRGPGSAGRIAVSYGTVPDASLPTDQQAQPWKDFVPVDTTIDMAEGVTRIPIQITILPNDEPELAESFILNITDVQLVGQVVGSGVGPRVRRPGNLAAVKISEHGNARGVVQFNVTRNIENRVDVHTGERISLSLSRALKTFGEVAVSWFAEPRTADASRFTPSSGIVTFADGQTSSSVDIAINNFLSQNLLTFDVKLLAVATVGASLGDDVSVLVGILPSDSPAGMFSISPPQVIIRESQSVSDPAGFATFTIIRAGTLGTVNVQWRIDPEAQNDFVLPITGLIPFLPGEAGKSLSVQSKPDSIVEGEERFRVSLVYADNGALISSSQSSAVIVILADPKAIGTIGVSPNSSTIAIGKPFPGYDGSGLVVLIRTQGFFGTTRVMWQMDRRDSNLFTQTQGNVTFKELQTSATINLQAVDNLTPILRQNFVLQLVSASGGALVQASASQAQVIFVASNYPRGLLEFDVPLVAIASQYQSQITVDVIRKFGSSGQVRVYYVTSPGNATSTQQPNADYASSSGSLTYNEGQTQQTVAIQIYNNNIPQGPVQFYLNLTRLELISPISDNYTYLNGLQLDQPPQLGTKTVKTIIIDKSNDAGGYVQLDALNVTAYRDIRFISLPVSRGPGTYGSISVKYLTTDLTAKLGIDYKSPDGVLGFLDGQTQTWLNISLLDDGLTKPARSFLVNLTNATGGARLGNRAGCLVTIARSGYPNGRFGFKGQSPLLLQNPDSLTTLTVVLERTGGLVGLQNVYWRIMGPNNRSRILTEVTDISITTADGLEATSGVLTWMDKEGGTKSIVLNIKPHLAWEVQEDFSLIIYDIRSNSASAATGDISPLAGSLLLVIQKFGYPNGVIRFDGVALSPRTFDKPVLGDVSIIFPIIRSQGMLGNISVSWRIDGPTLSLQKDFADAQGLISMVDGSPEAQITVTLIPDNTPSLNNQYTLLLTNVIGGADVDSNFQSSVFTIKYHDNPHGRFLISPALQQVVVQPVSLKRQLMLNITRIKGTFGSVLVNFAMSFDQALSGTSYLPSSGSVTVPNGVSSGIASVDLENSAFLPLGSNFTVTLTTAKFLDSGVTMAPDIVPEQNQVKVTVPQIAANSKVGFQSTVVTVNDLTGSVIATIMRLGSYGSIQVQWVSGYQSNDLIRDFAIGSITPSSGTASMAHGQETIQLMLQTSPQLQKPELFSVYLPSTPMASTVGGAQLLPGFTICRIDPYGVIQFSRVSRFLSVSLAYGQASQVSLQVERVYGSLDSVQVDYKIYTGSASGELDFKLIQYDSINMTQGQITTNLLIQVNSFGSYIDNTKHFYVTLVDAIRPQTGSSLLGNSPRTALNGTTAAIVVTIPSNAYGMLSVSLLPPFSNGVVAEGTQISVLVSRTGGSSGQVSARLRTVGGGESWDRDFDTTSGGSNETIGNVLSNRDITKQAFVGQDYLQLDVPLDFADRETSKSVTLAILNSTQPEYDEYVFVYVLPLTQGVRVALPSTDSGLKGYAVVTIMKHGLWNGWIGFYPVNSSTVVADKDSGKPPVLTIERQNATFTSVVVYWRALDGLVPRFPPINLADLLEATSGSVNCLAGQTFCVFSIKLSADKRPRNETWFLVEIYLDPSTTSALIDPLRQNCNVTLLKSNYPNGLIQIAPSSRVVVVNFNATMLQLMVERLGYLDKVVMVTYKTLQLDSGIIIAGLSASPALEGADYSRSVGTITFDYGVSSQPMIVTFDPLRASGGSYPKVFRVQLISVTSNAEMGAQWSNVTIVDPIDEAFWKIWVTSQQQQLDNDTILGMMKDLSKLLPKNITNSQLAITQDVLNTVLTVKENMTLAPSTSFSIMTVFCDLLLPGKIDATRGHWQLSKQLERYAYSTVDHSLCDISANSPDCVNANFQVYRKYPDDINGMEWTDVDQDSFTLPGSLLPVQSKGRYSSTPTCFTLVFVEYKTDQWFTSLGNKQLLNNRILSASIENRDSQSLTEPVKFTVKSPQGTMPPTLSGCIYFDEDFQQWTSGSGVCAVENSLILGVDNYVSCSCAHMSSYAVQINAKHNSMLVGFPIWFHISCFICMGCLTVVILTHHLCRPLHMFPINLLMHMCFAIISTEICYVIDGFLSPWHILHTDPGGDNYRCIIMSVFLHYFFLAQFCWLMIQAANLYRVLLLNDEHTKRFYLPFFLFGWIAPVIFVGIFYLVVYLIYRFTTSFPVDKIYGDVLGNSNFCFLTNGYVALGGILLPCAVCLLVALAVCVQAFALYQQWEDYDNIYSGKRNMREVEILFGFWFIFVLTCLWMTLHVSLGQMWTIVLFVIFNIILGLYGLIAYGIIRWTMCLECCAERDEKPKRFPPRHQNINSPIPVYSLPNRVSDESTLTKTKDLSPSQSKAMMDPDSETQQAPVLRVRRSAPSPTDMTSPYDKRPMSHGVNMLEDFDDIIYSLKNDVDRGGDRYKSENQRNKFRDRKTDRHDWDDSAQSEVSYYDDDLPVFYEKKRINIADTHI